MAVQVRSHIRKGRRVRAYSRGGNPFRMTGKAALSLTLPGFGKPRGPQPKVPKMPKAPSYLVADVHGHRMGRMSEVRKVSGKYYVKRHRQPASPAVTQALRTYMGY